MFEEMKAYLSVTTTPENRDSLVESAHLLMQAGVLSHESDIERVLRMADQFTTEDNILDLFSILTNYLDVTLTSFGLSVADEVPLNCLNHVLSGLLTIPNYGDPEALLTVCHREDSAEEKLIDLLDEVTSLSWANFAPYIDRVSSALIERIEKEVTENVPAEETREDLSLSRERLKRHSSHHPQLMVVDLIRNGVALGEPVETYLAHLEEALSDLEKNPEALSKELAGLLLASDLPNGDLRSISEDLLEDFAQDINYVTKTSTLLTRQLSLAIEVNREEA